ncbi:hypothetical protein F5Y12DRAFT_710924 [Xylaria sp. FL1777]|nr:hypothetical protein F5Y12DRAFT_710924 [Xylaria sp. FL1777]
MRFYNAASDVLAGFPNLLLTDFTSAPARSKTDALSARDLTPRWTNGEMNDLIRIYFTGDLVVCSCAALQQDFHSGSETLTGRNKHWRPGKKTKTSEALEARVEGTSKALKNINMIASSKSPLVLEMCGNRKIPQERIVKAVFVLHAAGFVHRQTRHDNMAIFDRITSTEAGNPRN